MKTLLPLAALCALAMTTAPGLAAGASPAAVAQRAATPDAAALSDAARAGDAAAIGRLKSRVARFDAFGNDRWLDAAMWGLYVPGPGADAVLEQLLVEGMGWEQRGPLDDAAARRLPVSRTSVLAHAVRAGRADWVARLMTLGARLTPGAQYELFMAVVQGDVPMVQQLLRLGDVDVSGLQNALGVALYGEQDAPGIAPHAAEVIAVLARQLVDVKKTPLAALEPNPLDRAAHGSADPHGAERVRLLLGAGFSPASLDAAAVDAILAAPDRTLAPQLLDSGMLRLAPGKQRPAGDAHVLLAAVAAHRADLLPRLLTMGFDPNLRVDGARSAVDAAIALGAHDELAVLLAHGGRMHAGATAEHSGALDLAVTSNDAAMLSLVTGTLRQRLEQVCVPDTNALIETLVHASDAYWELLRRQGFGAGDACPERAGRAIMEVVSNPAHIMAGWMGTRFGTRLRQLAPRGGSQEQLKMLADVVRGYHRADLLPLLAQAGWPVPPAQRSVPASAVDKERLHTLPGMYAEESLGAAGSTMLLRDDGTFVYRLAYQHLAEQATGTWEVRNQRVQFSSAVPDAAPFVLATPAGTAPEGTVRIVPGAGMRGKESIAVTLLGDAPVHATAPAGPADWRVPFTGPLRQVVLAWTKGEPRAPLVIDVPPGQALQRTFQFEPNPRRGPAIDFNLVMDVEDNGLTWQRNGTTLRYEKTAAPAR